MAGIYQEVHFDISIKKTLTRFGKILNMKELWGSNCENMQNTLKIKD